MMAPLSHDTTPLLGSSRAGTRPFSQIFKKFGPLTPFGAAPNSHSLMV